MSRKAQIAFGAITQFTPCKSNSQRTANGERRTEDTEYENPVEGKNESSRRLEKDRTPAISPL